MSTEFNNGLVIGASLGLTIGTGGGVSSMTAETAAFNDRPAGYAVGKRDVPPLTVRKSYATGPRATVAFRESNGPE